jgi:hypothetical protein
LLRALKNTKALAAPGWLALDRVGELYKDLPIEPGEVVLILSA